MHLISVLQTTKLFYSLDKSWYNLYISKNIRPRIIIYNEDLINASILTTDIKNIVLLSHSNDSKLARKLSKSEESNYILLSNKFITYTDRPQIIPYGYKTGFGKKNIIWNIHTAISMGIGLLTQCPYVKIGKEENLFDLFRKLMF